MFKYVVNIWTKNPKQSLRKKKNSLFDYFVAARDGTRAFMTGEFNDEGLVDDVSGLSSPEMLELEGWIKFYDKTYTYKGE